MHVQDFGEQTERIMSSAKMVNSLNSKVSFTTNLLTQCLTSMLSPEALRGSGS